MKGKSFFWAFLLFAAMLIGSSMLEEQGHISPSASALLSGLAGMIPLVIQAITGYSLNKTWEAEFSRTEEPLLYWLHIVLTALFSAFIWYVALSS